MIAGARFAGGNSRSEVLIDLGRITHTREQQVDDEQHITAAICGLNCGKICRGNLRATSGREAEKGTKKSAGEVDARLS